MEGHREEVRCTEARVSRIVEGLEEVLVLGLWKVLPSGNGCADAGVASQSTAEWIVECDMTRWLTFIRLFDFEVKHVSGTKNTGPDGLSRRGKAPTDEEEADPDDFFDAKIYFVSAEAQQRSQLGGKEYFDRTHRIRMTPLAIGDLVLLPHSSIEQSHNKKLDRKLDNRWIGPYRIREVKDNGSYLLAELDGAKPHGSVGTAKPELRSRNCGCDNRETRTMSAETVSFTTLKPEL